MRENRFYYQIFNRLKPEHRQRFTDLVCDLEETTIFDLTEEETKLLRQRLGVYGDEASLYKNIVSSDTTVSKLMTKLDHLEKKLIPMLEEYEISEQIRDQQIEFLGDYNTEQIIEMFGKENAKKVTEYAHHHGVWLQDETEADILPISILPVSNYAKNALMRRGVQTLGNLIQLSPQELQTIRGIGKVAGKQISTQLETMGYGLAEEGKAAALRLTK